MLSLKELQALDDAAFTRAIAEAAGWTFERVEVQWDASQQYRVRRPDGTVVAYLADSGRYTDIRPFSAIGDVIPDYAHDLNAAWGLFGDEFDGEWYLKYTGGQHSAWVFNVMYTARSQQPARALATAWYAWQSENRGE